MDRAPFSIQRANKRLCKGQYVEDRLIIRACRFIWQQKVPLKMGLFFLLLLRKRFMMRVLHRQLYPRTSADCNLCSGTKEDNAYLLFGCPFTLTIWTRQTILRVDTTLEMSFEESIRRSNCRRRADGFHILAML